MTLTIVPLTPAFARDIVSWRYDPPYDFYNIVVAPDFVDVTAEYFLAPENRFHQIERDGEPIAFVSFGPDGQVLGGDYRTKALDIGMGVSPDLTGRGLGGEIVREVIAYAIRQYAPRALRVTIAAFNARAIRVWTKDEFTEVSRFNTAFDNTPFVILMRKER